MNLPKGKKRSSSNRVLKRAKKEPRQNREAVVPIVDEQTLLRALMDNLADSIYFKDAESHFTRINQTQARRFGLKGPAQAIGKTDFDYFSEEHSRQAYEDEQEIIRSGKPLVGKEEKETWPDGRVGWVSTTKMPLRDQEGKIIGTFGVSRDITERKQVENEIKNLAKFPNENPFPVLRLNKNGIVLYANKASRPLLEDWNATVGQPTPEFLQKIVRYSIENETQKLVEISIDKKVLSFIVHPVIGEDYVNCYGYDITERKDAEERALRINRIYSTLSQINQNIVRLKERDQLFAQICRVAVEFGKYYMAWIGLVDNSTQTVRPFTFAGEENGYLTDIDIKYLDEELGRGPAGSAVREDRCVICEDIASDPLMKPWRESALAHRFRSVAAVPIHQGGSVIGVFTVYATEPHTFDTEQQSLLTEIGVDISFALDSLELEARRERADNMLLASELRYRRLFETAKDGILILDRDSGRIMDTNPFLMELLGYSHAEFLGKQLWEIGLFKDIAANKDSFLKLQEKEYIRYENLPLQTKEGKPIWVEFVSNTYPVDGKRVIQCNIRDITERRRAENELRIRDNAITSSITGFLIADLDGHITYVNTAWLKIFGYETTQQVLGSIPADHMQNPRDAERVRKELFSTGYWIGELNGKQHDGSTITVQLASNIVQDDTGTPICLLGSFIDITENKRMQQQLHTSEGKYRSLFQDAPLGILLANTNGKILEVNPAVLRILGSPSEEATKQINILTFQPLIKAGISAAFQNSVERKLSIRAEFPYTSKWGKSAYLEVAFTPILDDSGNNREIQVIVDDITERKEVEGNFHQRLAELEFLYQSGLGLGQLLEPEEVAQKIIEQMEKQMNWHHCAIRLYDAEAQTLKVIGINAPGLENEIDRQGLEEHFNNMVQKVGDGLTGQAIELGQTLRIGDLKRDPRYLETFPGLNSGLYVPIQINNRVIGVISVENDLPNAFSESDERLVNILANQVAIALENGRLHKETLQQLKQLRSLRSIDLAITSSLDLNVTIDILIHQAMQQLIVDGIAVFLLQSDINSLRLASSQGFKTNQLEDLKWISLADDSLLGLAVMERHILDSQCTLEPHVRLKNIWKEEKFHSMISLPLLSKGELKGVMGIFFRSEEGRPTKPQMDFMETLAGQAAIAIENVQLFDSLHKTNMELAIAYDATIEGWSRAMDLRDKETEGHTRRVVDMTMKLASYFGYSGETLMQIRRGALLHDIGKLGVPDSILLKPDKLTDEEWVIMKKHPAFAFEMLAPIHYLNQAINIPYCHHEKWDGTGYPRGLSGERIPLEARIFAVVDVWDALTSDRPYRKAWTREKALEHIGSLSGSHFDPQVIERFMQEMTHENK